MELALVLVVAVLVEMAATFYMLARNRDYRKRVTKLEKNVRRMAEVLRDMAEDEPVHDMADAPIAELVAKASEDDIAQAQEVLKALGVKVGN